MNIIMNVDYSDHCGEAARRGEGLYDEKRIKNLLGLCAENGVDTIFWRVSVAGKVAYHSRAMTVFNGEHKKNSAGLGEVLKRFDPLSVASGCARREGLKIYAWATLFDDYFPGLESDFGKKHPEYYWSSRDGEEHLRGVFCYAYPEVMDYKLKQIKELSEYDLDGVFLSTRQHARLSCPYRQADKYGFDKPVVDEYKRRYGVDISKFEDVRYHIDSEHYLFGFIDRVEYIGGDFDRDKWHRLKGEYLTKFLSESKKILKEKDVYMGILDPFEGYEGLHPIAQMHLDWKKWSDEKMIDGLVIIGTPVEKQDGRVETFSAVKENGTQLYTWHHIYGWNEYGEEEYPGRGFQDMGRIVGGIRSGYKTKLPDGYVLHEAAALEFGR